MENKINKVYLAGGCFWGVEEYYKRIKGILHTEVGYLNSDKEVISYEEVCSQKYHAIEGVYIEYDSNIITLDKILELLFRIIDPTSLDKQGVDVGYSYRVGFYYLDDTQKDIALKYVEDKQKEYDNKIVFEIEAFKSFCKAEDYHQDYLEVNPSGYCHVNFNKIKDNELKDEWRIK